LLNDDGTLWQEKLGGQMEIIGQMSAARAEAVLRTIAACLNTVITWAYRREAAIRPNRESFTG
jgi:type IV secretion system protein TrbB